ncbi:MAG: DUF6498-containing protein [Xanthomonadales bacterium]|nr:DUF6498-containing protein [Xanthomonadales bacterium]
MTDDGWSRRLEQLPASAWVLMAANLVPILGIWLFDWDVFSVLLVFWMENIAIGLVHILRMATADFARGSVASKLFLIPFFTVHYGGFALGHGFFVMQFFGQQEVSLEDPMGLWAIVTEQHLELAGLALLLSHLVSFALNDWRRPPTEISPARMMKRPYGRVIVLHVTILIGGLLVSVLGSPVWALVPLILLKTGMDLKAHLKDHRADAPWRARAALQ